SSKSLISDSKEVAQNIDGDYGKEVTTDKRVEKSTKDSSNDIVTAGFDKTVASRFGKKSREIKCFKCLGMGHIASQCPNKQVMTITTRGLIGEEEDDAEQSPDKLRATIDAYYEDKEAHVFEKLGKE